MFAWILRWICGRPVILSLDFSLLGSGVRKWSVQPWASSCGTSVEHRCGWLALSESCTLRIFQHANLRLVVFGLWSLFLFLLLTAGVGYPLVATSR